MLLISPYSSSDDLLIKNKNLFRLKCIDSHQGYIIARVLRSLNMKAIVIFYLNITWSEKIVEKLKIEYQKQGEIILSEVKYNTNNNYSIHLNAINHVIEQNMRIYGKNKIAIILIGIMETKEIINKLYNYPTLRQILWLRSEAIPSKLLSSYFQENVTEIFSDIKLLSPSIAPSYSKNYYKINRIYYKRIGEKLSNTNF
jgi:hypothetical protein